MQETAGETPVNVESAVSEGMNAKDVIIEDVIIEDAGTANDPGTGEEAEAPDSAAAPQEADVIE